MVRRIGIALVALSVTGCFGPPSPSQRLADSAYNLNVASRFGRMDIALENVHPEHRTEFAKGHVGWGKNVRVVDVEFGGMSFVSKEEADVFITVAWQRYNESTLQVTSLTQRWSQEEGPWRMMSEERSGGSFGLLGDADPDAPESSPSTPAAKPTKLLTTKVLSSR